jgi:phosphoribosylaminoimidazole-succinocarboxamide synthase
MMNWDQALILGFITEEELLKIKELTLKINQLLLTFFSERRLKLIDFKLEFGKFNEKIILADELSPDVMRIWDVETNKRLDKDVFRHGTDDLTECYEEILGRIK